MNKIWLFILVVGLAFGLQGCTTEDKNKPPGAPSISLPSEADINEAVVVIVRSTDPEQNEIAYKVRFGDGVDSEWSEYFPSGQDVTFTHKYEEAGDYRVKTVASDREAIGEWSEDKWIKIKTSLPPPPEPRLISILGTCLPGCESMWKDLGGTHFYGNRYGWPDYDEVERLGMKVFVNIRADDWRFSLEEQQELSKLREYVKSNVTRAKITSSTNLLAIPQYQINLARYKELLLKSIPNEGEIQKAVNAWKDRPGCGGYWSDTLGHEPDICNQPLEERIRFYDTVRKYDPDIVNHPIIEMFDLTETGDFPPEQHQGWEKAYDERTLDLLLFDCYVSDPSDEKMREDIKMFHDKFAGKYCKNIQVIPQLNAFNYRPGSIRVAYETWKELLGGEIGVAYYKDESIRENEEMQEEIKRVNTEITK